jgi:hypothetical protein
MGKKLKNANHLTLQTSQEFKIGKKIPLLSGSAFPVEV